MNGLQLPHFCKYRQSILYKLTVICKFSRFFGQKQKRGKIQVVECTKGRAARSSIIFPHSIKYFLCSLCCCCRSQDALDAQMPGQVRRHRFKNAFGHLTSTQ